MCAILPRYIYYFNKTRIIENSLTQAQNKTYCNFFYTFNAFVTTEVFKIITSKLVQKKFASASVPISCCANPTPSTVQSVSHLLRNFKLSVCLLYNVNQISVVRGVSLQFAPQHYQRQSWTQWLFECSQYWLWQVAFNAKVRKFHFTSD